MTNLNANNFWNTNLEDVEASFLPQGKKIIDLPTTLDERVPTQGSVILDKTININDEVKSPSVMQKFLFFMTR
jgi:hypothetical protein